METPATDFTLTLSPQNESVLRALAARQFAPRDAYALRLQAERLTLIAGFDTLATLDQIAIQPFPYQLKTAQTVLRRFRGRGLLCDEVGLGKTIEAGIVMKEYLARGLARRVLIITPPALVEQWRGEMAFKFGEEFITTEDADFRRAGVEAWSRFDRILASLVIARRAEHRAAIENTFYDLVIVDEAHHLKNRATVSWKFVNALQKKYILLLTATPVQNDLDELYNLITLLKPGQLKTPKEFRKQFVVRGDPRQPQNRGKLRELLADVMVRNSRASVSLNLPRRRAHTLRLKLSPPERELYDAVGEFVRRAYTTEGNGTHRFVLQTLQREIGSSAFAVRPTLEKMMNAPDRGAETREELARLASMAAAVRASAKTDALLKLLTASDEKVIVFTHFLETLHYLADQFRARQLSFVLYHGGLTTAEKDAAIHTFEREKQILLSTEAAGEGRNLQFCWRMINFDLPWNPMRIEQRVGRIHRIGQTHPVEIFNLAAEGTIEDFILHILDTKINMFELVIGEMDMILGHLADERDFEEIVLEMWARSGSRDEFAVEMERLGDALVEARQAYLQTKEYDEALFGKDLGVE